MSNSKSNPSRSILFVHDYSPQQGGGLVVNTWNIAEGFAHQGWRVSLASPEVERNYTVDGFSIIKVSDLNQFRNVIENHSTLIINLNFSMRPGAVGTTQICQKLNRPYYIWFRTTLKNLFFYRYADQGRFEQETRLEQLKNLLNDNLCIKVICVSQTVKSDLIRLGVAGDKLEVIYDSVEMGEKKHINQVSTRPDKTNELVFVGRLSLEKGPRYLVDATKILQKEHPNIKVSIVGQGPEENYLKTMVNVLSLDRNITFYGYLPNGEVLEFVKRHKIYCCCSLTESFGISILEAMLVGVPVIAPNIEGPKEILQDGKYGRLFELGNTKDLADKITSVLGNPQEATKMAYRARKYALQKFSIQRQIVELENLITKNSHISNKSFSNLSVLSNLRV